MLLLLVRHAHAGQRDPVRLPDDRQRPITDLGRTRQRRVTNALERMGVIPDVILTSPWTRAVQTAEVMVQSLGIKIKPKPVDALAAEPDLEKLQAALGDPGADATVAMVGHSPWIEELASLLLTGDPSGLKIDFPKSGILGARADALRAGDGELWFFMRPRQARKGSGR